MTTWLKQSTATDVEIGAFVDDTDGKSPETALLLSQADCQLIKNGGAAAQKSDATAATHRGGGHYTVPLNTTDTNTLGRLRLYINESGALPQWRDFQVVPANVYDSLVGGSDKLQVHADEITAGLITAAAIATGAIDADAVASDAVTEIQSGLATTVALTTLTNYVDTEIAAILAAVDTEVAAIKAKTDNLPTDPADDSDIDTQLAAIAAYLDTEIAAILAAVDTEVAAIKAKTDNLPASPAAVGSEMTLSADAVNSTSLAESAVAEIQSGLSTLSPAQVNAEVVDALAVDTYAEPGSVPAATSSLASKISWLFSTGRNKRITSATQDKIRNDADSADIGTASLVDNGTTFTRGEYA